MKKSIILCTVMLTLCSVLAVGMDITFLVVSDTHYGCQIPNTSNRAQIKAMNGIPGIQYPEEIGGIVEIPWGVLLAGDITNIGSIAEWDSFVKDYGLTGNDGLLSYPCYECSGNHDSDGIRTRIVERHGNITYSWNWGPVHIISLDVYPTIEYSTWLAQRLEIIGTERPVILFHHYGFDPWSLSWWSDEEREAYGEAIADYNIIAIFHGHSHDAIHYGWRCHSINSPGTTSLRQTHHSFLVVRLTDDALAVAEYVWEMNASGQWIGGEWGWTHKKTIPTEILRCGNKINADNFIQNYPNPFSLTTTISFTIPENALANLFIFNIEGKLITTLIDEVLDEGLKEVTWAGKDAKGNPVSSGIYFYRLKAGKRTLTKKMVLLR